MTKLRATSPFQITSGGKKKRRDRFSSFRSCRQSRIVDQEPIDATTSIDSAEKPSHQVTYGPAIKTKMATRRCALVKIEAKIYDRHRQLDSFG
jgi:hypothetical protein